ncbi:MAG TPA: DUF1304 domain-containing protein [Pyrinomonadaceae bacterium]|nr:DUF1304 domain-containing protein [Pyrinomonadaceae bacterium]
MRLISNGLIVLVAIEHIGFLILEMFFWDHPIGQRIFGLTPEVSAASAALAANQGLYNGFLAAGLIWGVVSATRNVNMFFLVCIIIAGIFGALTAKGSIILFQGLPAFLALAATLAVRQTDDGL